MTQSKAGPGRYDERVTETMQLVYGEGFFSPGGPDEVCRIVAGLEIDKCEVLDVGCGIGGPAVALVRDAGAARVVGIDIQQLMIDHARERVSTAGLQDRIELRRVEPGPFPFADECFDIVYVTAVICKIAELTPFLTECRRMLRPGGYLVGTDWFTAPAAPSARREFDTWAAELAERGLEFHFITLKTFERQLSALGFESMIEDTSETVCDEAKATLKRIRGPLRARVVEIIGEAGYQRFFKGSQARIRALESKSLVHCRFRSGVASI